MTAVVARSSGPLLYELDIRRMLTHQRHTNECSPTLSRSAPRMACAAGGGTSPHVPGAGLVASLLAAVASILAQKLHHPRAVRLTLLGAEVEPLQGLREDTWAARQRADPLLEYRFHIGLQRGVALRDTHLDQGAPCLRWHPGEECVELLLHEVVDQPPRGRGGEATKEEAHSLADVERMTEHHRQRALHQRGITEAGQRVEEPLPVAAVCGLLRRCVEALEQDV